MATAIHRWDDVDITLPWHTPWLRVGGPEPGPFNYASFEARQHSVGALTSNTTFTFEQTNDPTSPGTIIDAAIAKQTQVGPGITTLIPLHGVEFFRVRTTARQSTACRAIMTLTFSRLPFEPS